jgi:hypothetical protein
MEALMTSKATAPILFWTLSWGLMAACSDGGSPAPGGGGGATVVAPSPNDAVSIGTLQLASGNAPALPTPLLDAGKIACCPAGWDMYTCIDRDGGHGLACHDPQEGCPSSLYCGEGCDPVVSGRCSAPADAAAEAGSADAAVQDTSVADAPVTDAPVADTSVADAPAADAPVSDAPVADGPASDGAPLQWWVRMNCGPDYCGCPVSDAGILFKNCPPVGSSCAVLGETCGLNDAGLPPPCFLVCDDMNPNVDGGGAPVTN